MRVKTIIFTRHNCALEVWFNHDHQNIRVCVENGKYPETIECRFFNRDEWGKKTWRAIKEYSKRTGIGLSNSEIDTIVDFAQRAFGKV